MPEAPDLEAQLDVAVDAARRAGRIQMERYERLERIVHKSEHDVVTEVDNLSEALIIEALTRVFRATPSWPRSPATPAGGQKAQPRGPRMSQGPPASGQRGFRTPDRLTRSRPITGSGSSIRSTGP